MIDSLILRVAGRALFWPLLTLSWLVLYRGHNLPGGGFIGGLLAAAPFILISLGSGVEVARRRLSVEPLNLVAAGLAIALASALSAGLAGATFFTGLWLPSFALPLIGTIHLGTPLLFDVGVYLTVAGFSLAVIFNLEDLD